MWNLWTFLRLFINSKHLCHCCSLCQVKSSALEFKAAYHSIEDVMKKFIVTENEIVESTIPLLIKFIEKGVRIH